MIDKQMSPNDVSRIYQNPNDSGFNYNLSLNHSLSASKNDFAYGNSSKKPQFNINNSLHKQATSAGLSTVDDTLIGVSHLRQNKKRTPISQSVQNSTKKNKNKSITDRLDSTENLLKKMSKKFDHIFKDKTKFNIDMSKIKHKKKENISDTKKVSKEKYTGKMKTLMEKIINNNGDLKYQTDPSSSCKSPESSMMSIDCKISEETIGRKNSGSKARYGQIDEETSDINSDGLNLEKIKENIGKNFPILIRINFLLLFC